MLVLLLALACMALAANASIARLEAEVVQSLKNNIVGCPYQLIHMNYSIMRTNRSDEFLVRPMFPTKHEVNIFQRFPVSLTQANKALAETSAKAGFDSKWGSTSTLRSDLPADHPGQDRNNCINMTLLAASEKVISFYETYKQTQRGFYVMHARKAFIHPSGAVGLSCGYFVGNEGCEVKTKAVDDWQSKCRKKMAETGWAWDSFFDHKDSPDKLKQMVDACAAPSDFGQSKDAKVAWHDKVFTIPALWDYNYHHFVTDSLVRLSRNYRYLKTHVDVKIHIRSHEDYDSAHNQDAAFRSQAKKMRNEFFDLLGIDSSRIISGPVFAQEVFVPRFMKCSYLLSNPAELRLLNKQLTVNTNNFLARNPEVRDELFNKMLGGVPSLKGAHTRTAEDVALSEKYRQGKVTTITPPAFKKEKTNVARRLEGIVEAKDVSRALQDMRSKRLIVYQQRTTGESTATLWNDATLREVVDAFSKHFLTHQVVPVSSADLTSPSHCLACDITSYSHADVLIAAHGSGLTNMLFMRPGSLVIEIVGAMTASKMPVCGYYGPLAAGLGLHHYIFAYDHAAKKPMLPDVAVKAAGFYNVLGASATKTVVRVHGNSTARTH